ncbi:LysR substrate-binding domain-containing protein [Sorangium sp. So ce260]|uniref:LysR substrate-binding domain-containing protein n=1 Tax=Sorangium sp. So ce260 TaxID=3133291 RepID=UPI003F633E0C
MATHSCTSSPTRLFHRLPRRTTQRPSRGCVAAERTARSTSTRTRTRTKRGTGDRKAGDGNRKPGDGRRETGGPRTRPIAATAGSCGSRRRPAWSGTVLAPLVGELARVHPDIRVDIRVTNRVLDLAEGGIDLAIRSGPFDGLPGHLAQTWFAAPWVLSEPTTGRWQAAAARCRRGRGRAVLPSRKRQPQQRNGRRRGAVSVPQEGAVKGRPHRRRSSSCPRRAP